MTEPNGIIPVTGSSPRLRGTHRRAVRQGIRTGIIPALAGNTSAAPTANRNSGDHPRACGEHARRPWPPIEILGSSPRLRGTRVIHGVVPPMRGIIPALAGNTRPSRMTSNPEGDHPRACGEHGIHNHKGHNTPGSSPRLRGTLRFEPRAIWALGIIPALAGNTRSRSSSTCICWDHPRACGEHYISWLSANSRAGSSPRLRGTRYARERVQRHRGIIPALAGNTSSRTP